LDWGQVLDRDRSQVSDPHRDRDRVSDQHRNRHRLFGLVGRSVWPSVGRIVVIVRKKEIKRFSENQDQIGSKNLKMITFKNVYLVSYPSLRTYLLYSNVGKVII
jgi:hypothetical protein